MFPGVLYTTYPVFPRSNLHTSSCLFPGVLYTTPFIPGVILLNSYMFLEYSTQLLLYFPLNILRNSSFIFPGVFYTIYTTPPKCSLEYTTSSFMLSEVLYTTPLCSCSTLKNSMFLEYLHNSSYMFPGVLYTTSPLFSLEYTKNSSLILSEVLYTTPPKCFMEYPKQLLLYVPWRTLHYS